MKLTVLENGKVRVGFREQIEAERESVVVQVRAALEEIVDQATAMLEVYESDYFQKKGLSTILVTDTGITTSATRSPKEKVAEPKPPKGSRAGDGSE